METEKRRLKFAAEQVVMGSAIEEKLRRRKKSSVIVCAGMFVNPWQVLVFNCIS